MKQKFRIRKGERKMKEVSKIFVLTLIYLFSLSVFPSDLEDVLERNTKAVGGKEKLSSISNISVKVGDVTIFASKEGKMKILKGKSPACVEVLVLDGEKIIKNSIRGSEEVKGIEKVLNIFQAKIFSGIFTASSFGRDVKYNGMKNFGMKKFHELSTTIDGTNINLYIDNDDFLMKRAVLTFYTPENEKQEINYDFGPYFENEGIKVPSSWFVSRVGARGNLYEIEEVRFNIDLPEQFFKDINLNIGNVQVSKGELKGNVIDFYERQGRLFIVSNWTKECFGNAGIETGEVVILKILGRDFELSFYQDMEDARRAGTLQRGNLISKTPDTEFYTIFISEPSSLRENLQILQPMELKKR